MGRKPRNPEQTGREPTPPWKPGDPCPCGGSRLYAQCCLGIDGRPYKSPVWRRPPGPQTGFSQARCYMGWSHDCDQQISGEHFISASVLTQLGGPKVKLNGVPWLAVDETKILPISSLTGNILCRRHNEAFSQLDAMAGKFFAALKSTHIRQRVEKPHVSLYAHPRVLKKVREIAAAEGCKVHDIYIEGLRLVLAKYGLDYDRLDRGEG